MIINFNYYKEEINVQTGDCKITKCRLSEYLSRPNFVLELRAYLKCFTFFKNYSHKNLIDFIPLLEKY